MILLTFLMNVTMVFFELIFFQAAILLAYVVPGYLYYQRFREKWLREEVDLPRYINYKRVANSQKRQQKSSWRNCWKKKNKKQIKKTYPDQKISDRAKQLIDHSFEQSKMVITQEDELIVRNISMINLNNDYILQRTNSESLKSQSQSG